MAADHGAVFLAPRHLGRRASDSLLKEWKQSITASSFDHINWSCFFSRLLSKSFLFGFVLDPGILSWGLIDRSSHFRAVRLRALAGKMLDSEHPTTAILHDEVNASRYQSWMSGTVCRYIDVADHRLEAGTRISLEAIMGAFLVVRVP